MANLVARGNQQDLVNSPDGSGECCAFPSIQRTDQCSSKVFVAGFGVVRLGDAMQVHNFDGPCCNPHAPVLSSASSKVFVEGRGVGRKGDAYGGDHVIQTGVSRIFIG